MNYFRLGLAALGGTAASFAIGFLVMWLVPALFEEAHKYPAVFRSPETMMDVMPIAVAANFVSILVAAIVFAMVRQGSSGLAGGARLGVLFGVLFGVFAVCNALHNYVNLNIGLNLALGQSAAYFVQWVAIGTVIGLIYKPLAAP